MSEMAAYGIVPQKIELKPRRYHGYAVILFILGTLFPPLAVAARFGIGKDFWLNLLLTICGYIPGHGHNFYIQNIRNNKNHARTPKWVQKYGLVDLSEIRRKERKSQWAGRYKDRLPRSAYEGQAYEDGQVPDSSSNPSLDANGQPKRQADGELWRPEDESYYTARNDDASSSRWHYPANFDDAVLDRALLKQKKKKKDKKNRWERTQDAYSISAEDESSSHRKRSKKKKKKSSATDSIGTQSTHSGDSQEFPEDAEGGLYGNTSRAAPPPQDAQFKDNNTKTTDEDVFKHQF